MTWTASSINATNTLTFNDINDNVLTNVQTRELELKAQITVAGPNPTTQQLLVLQQKMQEWSMLVELQATLAKTKPSPPRNNYRRFCSW